MLISRPGWFYAGLGLSVAAHALVLGFYLLAGERVRDVVHHITFEPPLPPRMFYKAPRTTVRALEFRKVPVPRGSYNRRRSRLARTQMSEVQALAAARTENLLRQLDAARIAPSLMRPGMRMGMGADPVTRYVRAPIIPATLSKMEVRSVKETVQQIDLKLDMLSIEDMDTGQYQAMVIQDPNDRRAISGFLHLAQVLTRSRPISLSADLGRADPGDQEIPYINLDYLIKALDEYTGIKADYLGAIPLDDPRLMQVPWLLLPAGFYWFHALTEREIECFGRYLAAGGFAIIRTWPNEKMKGGLFDKFRRALKSQRLNEGADWRFVYLKPDHPIYHSFFDFDMSVRDNMKLWTTAVGDMGLVIGERLAALLPNGRIVTASARVGTGNGQIAVDGRRHLQFTVNTVVFALTQEGGVTQQWMSRLDGRSREDRVPLIHPTIR